MFKNKALFTNFSLKDIKWQYNMKHLLKKYNFLKYIIKF